VLTVPSAVSVTPTGNSTSALAQTFKISRSHPRSRPFQMGNTTTAEFNPLLDERLHGPAHKQSRHQPDRPPRVRRKTAPFEYWDLIGVIRARPESECPTQAQENEK